MFKTYVKFFIRLGIVIALYFMLSNFIENRMIILGIFVAIAAVYLIFAIKNTKNYAAYLEIVVNPQLHYEKIENLKDDSNKYNLLKAYGLYYEGKFDEARSVFNSVNYQTVSDDKRLDFVYTVVKLGLLFEEKQLEEYKATYSKAVEEKIFLKVRVNKDIFKVKEYVLEEKYEDAIELAILIIPRVQPRLFVVELEYLLAKSYFELNKLDDCNAVSEFISEKDYKVMFTDLCRQFLIKMNRQVY